MGVLYEYILLDNLVSCDITLLTVCTFLSFCPLILQQKQQENEGALRLLPPRLAALDQMGWEERQLALIEGLMAGNVFDWGAKEVAHILETQDFGFKEAMAQLQGDYPQCPLMS